MVIPFSAAEVEAFRADFPFVQNSTQNTTMPLAYLDSAATSQKPWAVLNAEKVFLETQNSSVHRGASSATGEATMSFERARELLAKLVGVKQSSQLFWSAGATDGLNLIAQGMAEASTSLATEESRKLFALGHGDEILVTEAEHHANLIPWQRLAAKTGASLKFIPVDDRGIWSLEAVKEGLNSRTRVFAFGHVSNVTGFQAPVREIVDIARSFNTLTVLDACQSVPHIPVDFDSLGVDFAVWSAHKMLGPNGLGTVFGREELLAALPPARTGGSAITSVTMEAAEFLPPPHKFEAGTQAVSQVIAMGAAAEYLLNADMDRVKASEQVLVEQLVDGINRNPHLRLLGPDNIGDRVALAAVEVKGIHAHDVGQVLDGLGVQVRVGHHCAQPLHRALGITSSVRASVHITSTAAEIDRFLSGLDEAVNYFTGSR